MVIVLCPEKLLLRKRSRLVLPNKAFIIGFHNNSSGAENGLIIFSFCVFVIKVSMKKTELNKIWLNQMELAKVPHISLIRRIH